MNTLLLALENACGTYIGEGINHEGQIFSGTFQLRSILDGRGFAIQFFAVANDGAIYHQEESIIAPAISQSLTLWNFNSNNPALLAHEIRNYPTKVDASNSLVFGFNRLDDRDLFREEIALDIWQNGDVSYTYSWGMPGGDFKERSGVRMARA
jgi:hypothetical protein